MSKPDKWDIRFLEAAELIASWSKDPSTKVGALIARPDKTIASMGFNGFPRGCIDDETMYSHRERKLSRIIHAEMNAILHSKEDLHGYALYVWPPGPRPACCDRCTAHIIQAGIKKVVHVDGNEIASERWKESVESSSEMFEEAGVEVVSLSLEYFDS